MKKIVIKSILLAMAFALSATIAFGQEELTPPLGYAYVTFPESIGQVVPAYTKVEFVVYFKPEYVPVYGVCKTITFFGYTTDKPTPFTYEITYALTPDLYPENIKTVEFRIYSGDGKYCSQSYSSYVNACTVNCLPRIYKPVPYTTE